MNQYDSHDQFQYDPNHLLDTLRKELELANDAALSRVLGVPPPMISKIRHYRIPIGASILIRMHEVTAWSIKDLRVLMGDRREQFPIGNRQARGKGRSGAVSGS